MGYIVTTLKQQLLHDVEYYYGLLHGRFSLGLPLNPVDGGDMFLCNVG
jgi:hypothetical protein